MANTSITRQPFWLNKTRMAESLGISVQAFDKWGVEAVAKVGRESFYDVRSILDNRLKHQGGKQQPAGPDGETIDPFIEYRLLQERLRLTAGQATAQERKNLVTEKELVPVDFMVFALGRLAAMLGSTLDTIPKSLKRKHPDIAIRHLEALEREIAVTRNEAAGLSEAIPEILDDYIATLDEGAG
ncbi:terminase small subunit [Pseudomonas lundensis]|uniref:terminase small subunit n=1 Tax=Pseudomonas lundensis TaxID=86185 RepID=UPI0014738233|nr:terminase small subunit [Pseudomonas lundensis]NMZ98083.1 DNA-packaging protein [Pseudomonas lundensis]